MFIGLGSSHLLLLWAGLIVLGIILFVAIRWRLRSWIYTAPARFGRQDADLSLAGHPLL